MRFYTVPQIPVGDFSGFWKQFGCVVALLLLSFFGVVIYYCTSSFIRPIVRHSPSGFLLQERSEMV